jgi:predicted MFS family arabinose efflux permease
MAASEAFALFLTIRFTAGVASAFVMIFVSSIVFSALAAAGRSDLQWVHFGGVGTGIASSAVLVAAVSAAGLGWRADWVGAAALSALGLVLVIAALPGRGAVSGVAEREPPLKFTPAFRSILASYALFGFGYIVTATFLIAIMRSGAASASLEAVVWLCTGLAGIPSVYLWGRAVRRFGLRPVIAASCIVEAAGVIASVALGGVAGPVIGGVLLGGTFVAITAFGLQAGRMLAAESPRKALAAMTAAFGTGQILGPVVAGFVADRTGGFFWPSLLAALALVGAALLALSSRRAQEGLPAASR